MLVCSLCVCVPPEDGTWQLPTSEEDIREFLSTLERCYSDLYW